MARMTEDERIRRQAARKADAKNAKLLASAGPLFAEQVPAEEFTDADAEYWKKRQSFATSPRGEEAGYLARIDFQWNLRAVRRIALAAMGQEDYAVAVQMDDKHGDRLMYWRGVLLGQRRMTIGFERIVKGWKPCYLPPNQYRKEETMFYMEDVEVRPTLAWPPEGWRPPLTAEEFDRLVKVPEAQEAEQTVDPWNLARI